MTVIATAGHVDHGKSTLVLRLTGTDPDRWQEEKSRGLTIDLGFATTTLASGAEVSFVDVPGHIRFLRNMLSGVGAVDGCVFVVSAVEGWKPQSEEHLRILSLLGLQRGVIAVTKVDLVDEDLLELAMLDVEEHVEGTFLQQAPIIGVSATEAVGIDELRVALDQMVDTVGEADFSGASRLWIDRSFAPAGAGTVITGTLTGGPLAVGDQVQLVPGDRKARIRGLQSHHRDVEKIEPSNRVAVNLTGIHHGELRRGHVLIDQGSWHTTAVVDAELEVLADLGHAVSRRGSYAVYLGSGEFPSKLRVLQAEQIEPGTKGLVRLFLDRPAPLLPGDRFILRESGRDLTIGGGELLDIDPILPATKANPDRSVDRVIAERAWVEVEQLFRLTGERREPDVGNWVVDPGVLQDAKAAVLEEIETAGALGLDVAALDDRQRAVLDLLHRDLDTLSVEAGRVKLGQAPDPLADHWWVAALEAEPFTPPGPDGVDRAEIRELVRHGYVVEQDRVFFAKSSIDRAVALVGEALEAQPTGLTVAEVRDLLSTSRKYVLALLAHLDANAITRRRDDVRIAGPRMPKF